MPILEKRGRAVAGLRCPDVQSINYAASLFELPRRVLDACLLWHAQLRLDNLTDVDFLDGHVACVYALDWDSAPLGALAWSTQADGSWWTQLGYVEPRVRRQGLYQLLWEHTVWQAKEQGVRRIQGGTHVNNKPMQALMEKLGRTPHSIIYDYEVAP